MRQPSFDTWTTIFLFAAIQGIFVASILWFARKENRFNKSLLALIIVLFSITLVEYVAFWTGYIRKFPHAMSLSAGFPFTYGVLLFFYFRNVFRQQKLKRKDWLHLIPFLLFLIYMSPVYSSSAEVKLQWMQGKMVLPSLFHWPFAAWKARPFIPWLSILHMSIYTIIIYGKYYSFSRTNPEVREWFRWLMGLFSAFILSFTSYYILIRFPFFNSAWDYMISFSMMFFICFIAWFGYLQPKVFSGLSIGESIKQPERYKNSPLTADMSRQLLQKLESLMNEKKLYQQSDLRLEKVAAAMNVSRHHLSQVINEQTDMSFFEYINRMRIHEAQQLLIQKTKSELNIIDVAYAVGFNNKVSFNTTFKKITGKTPTEFRKEASTSIHAPTFQ